MNRFYVPDLNQPILTGDEARHCTQVLRLQPGDTVTIFDGRGREAHCRIDRCDNGSTVQLAVLQPGSSAPLRTRITLAQAIPKRSMDLIVQKATELGVSRIVPLISDRTVIQLDERSNKIERWRNVSLEACKQCGNNWLPEIPAPVKASRFLQDLGPYDLKLIGSLQPDSQPLKTILAAARADGDDSAPARFESVLVLIGPEGDFTPAELNAAKTAGCHPLSLGPLVLRAETAALYTLSILHHELQVA